MSFDNGLLFGVGYNQFYDDNPDFDKKIIIQNDQHQLQEVNAGMHLFYISAHAEYVFYQLNKWKLTMPLQFGIGQTSYSYKLNNRRTVVEKKLNFIYEPAVSIEYQAIRWVGLGADIGYRFLVTDDVQLINKFTAPTYAFKVLIFYNELYRAVFKKRKKEND